ncbi:MAG: glycogen synthase [Lentisphaeria bacterium]|nr:glycogen synthase [Lentisphaeria bacterium]
MRKRPVRRTGGKKEKTSVTVPAPERISGEGRKHYRIFWCASECAPFAKTGGLADVSAALPQALARRGHDLTVILPYYNWKMNPLSLRYDSMFPLEVPFRGGTFRCRVRTLRPEKGLTYCFIEYDRFFDRPGLYDWHGASYGDNGERFIFFSRACMELVSSFGMKADILHLNDWHTALCAAYLKSPLYRENPVFRECRSVLTLHNVGYQGDFPGETFACTGLPPEFFRFDALEYYGRLNLLKGGIDLADEVNTVSPTYAGEILSPAYGCGLEGALRHCAGKGRLRGILNGIDVKKWDPACDKFLPAPYGVSDMSGKEEAKKALAEHFRLSLEAGSKKRVPFFGVLSRLASQKGLDVLADALEGLLPRMEARFVLIGAGDPHLEWRYRSLAERHRGKFACHIGMAEDSLAHLLEAGCDFFLMPSRYEPCGLNQMYSMRYGTLPVVRGTGGLADTVKNYDANDPSSSTGFVFYDLTVPALQNTISWADSTYRNAFGDILTMRKNGMSTDFSWDRTAEKYEEMYSHAHQ